MFHKLIKTNPSGIRKNRPQLGMIYDEDKDAFYFKNNNTGSAPSVFNEETARWISNYSWRWWSRSRR